MDDTDGISDLLASYSTPTPSMTWPGESEFAPDRRTMESPRSARDKRQTLAWDAALGDPNYGYPIRLPDGVAGVRDAAVKGAANVADTLFGWMTPEQRERLALTANFLGPAAPMAKAMFLTPAMVKRAADVLPVGKGTTEAWADAKSMLGPKSISELLDMQYSNPALLSRIYDETGWMPPYTMSPHQDRALAWHPTPVELSTDAARAVKGDGRLGTFDSMLADTDAKQRVLAAAPWLKDTNLMMEASPSIDSRGGTATPMPGEWSGMVHAKGPTLDDAMSVLHHEMFHAGPQANMRKLGMDTSAEVPKTKAERLYEALLRRAQDRGANEDTIARLQGRVENAREFARYLNDPFEHLARVSSVYETNPSLVATRPDLVDSLSDSGMSRISDRARSVHPDPDMPEISYRDFISPDSPIYRSNREP